MSMDTVFIGRTIHRVDLRLVFMKFSDRLKPALGFRAVAQSAPFIGKPHSANIYGAYLPLDDQARIVLQSDPIEYETAKQYNFKPFAITSDYESERMRCALNAVFPEIELAAKNTFGFVLNGESWNLWWEEEGCHLTYSHLPVHT